MDYAIVLSVISMVFAFILLQEITRRPLPKNNVTKVFYIFAILCFFCPLLKLVFFLVPPSNVILKEITFKAFLVENFLWINAFALGVYSMAIYSESVKANTIKQTIKKANSILLPFMAIVSLALIISPVSFDYSNGVLPHVTGFAMLIFYYACGFCGLSAVIMILLKIKQVGYAKYIPFLIFIALSLASLFMNSTYQTVSTIIISSTLMEYLIYFAIVRE